MFDLDQATLEKMGAAITTREIQQQPGLWQESWQLYQQRKEAIQAFLDQLKAKFDHVKVIFTGAGTSQYVGDTILPYLKKQGDRHFYQFESVGTTDLVSAPYDYLFEDEPTLLVSFARSGNSPESLASVDLANQIVKDIYHIYITCAQDGQLALSAQGQDQVLLLLMPEKSNDAGFAMTGSFSCMALTALLVFDQTDDQLKQAYVTNASHLGQTVIDRHQAIANFLDRPYERVVYLGSGSLAGLTREAQLKILELTAGQVATLFDSSMGFRHGPKSFVNDKTLVCVFVNNHPYSRLYDIDILNEIYDDKIAGGLLSIGQFEQFEGEKFILDQALGQLPDAYLTLPDIVFAQTVALLSAIKVGNKPDTPSPTGTVNRVVKGVTIHDYH